MGAGKPYVIFLPPMALVSLTILILTCSLLHTAQWMMFTLLQADALMSIIDLKMHSVCPHDWNLLGMQWREKLYRYLPSIWAAFSAFLYNQLSLLGLTSIPSVIHCIILMTFLLLVHLPLRNVPITYLLCF